MRLPGTLEMDSSDNEAEDLLMKGLLLNPHPGLCRNLPSLRPSLWAVLGQGGLFVGLLL